MDRSEFTEDNGRRSEIQNPSFVLFPPEGFTPWSSIAEVHYPLLGLQQIPEILDFQKIINELYDVERIKNNFPKSKLERILDSRRKPKKGI